MIRKVYSRCCSIIFKIINDILFIKHHVQTGHDIKIWGIIHYYGTVKNSIFLGNNVVINSGHKYNPIGKGNKTTFYILENGQIYIGNNVGISNVTIASCEKVVIENDVMIGGGTVIYDTDFHSLDKSERITTKRFKAEHAQVNIKQGAFVGADVIILKGVTIGENSIIGAGAVVTCNIPDNEIWAGNPAKFIRKLV